MNAHQIEAIVQFVEKKSDVLVNLPTGFEKSLTKSIVCVWCVVGRRPYCFGAGVNIKKSSNFCHTIVYYSITCATRARDSCSIIGCSNESRRKSIITISFLLVTMDVIVFSQTVIVIFLLRFAWGTSKLNQLNYEESWSVPIKLPCIGTHHWYVSYFSSCVSSFTKLGIQMLLQFFSRLLSIDCGPLLHDIVSKLKQT